MGVALAYTYAINRNLLDSIIANLIYNTFLTYVAVHREVSEIQEFQDVSDVLPDVMPAVLISALVLVLMGWIYKRKVLVS